MNGLFHSTHSTNPIPTARQLEQRRHAAAARRARRNDVSLVDRLLGRTGRMRQRYDHTV